MDVSGKKLREKDLDVPGSLAESLHEIPCEVGLRGDDLISKLASLTGTSQAFVVQELEFATQQAQLGSSSEIPVKELTLDDLRHLLISYLDQIDQDMTDELS